MEAVTLADYQRGVLRDAFRAAVARGDARPLLFPACIVPSILVPAVFIAVAGRYTSLRPLRYTLATAVAAFHAGVIWPRSGAPYLGSVNMAVAYGVGFGAAWCILWVFVVLVWMNPWDVERVARRARAAGKDVSIAEADCIDEDVARCLRAGQEYYWQSFPVDGSFWSRFGWGWDLCIAWRGSGWSWCMPPMPCFAPPKRPHTDELVQLSSLPLVSYQGYRRHRTRAAFLRNRLLTYVGSYLVVDLIGVLMSHDPSFVLGPPPGRFHGPKKWSADVRPYPGGLPPPPAALFAVPAYLDALYTHHPIVLALFRSTLGIFGILTVLQAALVLDQIVRVAFGPLLFPATSTSFLSTATQLWNYPTVYGSVTMLLDHGMAGFWGGWWHQTFRMAFVAPTKWLVDHGILPGPKSAGETDDDEEEEKTAETDDKEEKQLEPAKLPQITRLAGLTTAFSQSAFLHAAGSITSLPKHACWPKTAAFFLLAGVGVVVQTVLQMGMPDGMPRPLRRAGHVLFAMGWLQVTQWLFIDDLARGGLWLYEPVPFSLVRLLTGLYYGDSNVLYSPAGSSRAGHAAWRLYRDDVASWYSGPTWWEKGVAL